MKEISVSSTSEKAFFCTSCFDSVVQPIVCWLPAWISSIARAVCQSKQAPKMAVSLHDRDLSECHDQLEPLLCVRGNQPRLSKGREALQATEVALRMFLTEPGVEENF